MYLVGLTGGIASGKSHVAGLFGRLGASLIDADEVAREVVAHGTAGLEQVVGLFGKQVLLETGELDRNKLGEIIFSDATKRVELEKILHPLIKLRTTELINQHSEGIVIYSVPLLVEAKVDYPFDAVITVEAGVDNQLARLMSSRSMPEEDARKRIQAQASETEREAIADYVIDSSGSKEQTNIQAQIIWDKLIEASERKSNDAAN
jgi:dephospho-CoA kinase